MRRFLTALLVALAVVASACSVPDRGDIHTTTLEHRGSDEDVIPYSPAGPAPGASPSEIVNGFIEAMKAAPINTAYAKRFLTDDAASAWDPSKRTIVYSELVDHGGSSQVMLTAKQGDWLDGRGVWHGRIPVDGTPLPFRLTKVAGEWRISSAPDALVVESAWFESHFARSLLYYFDPSGRFLVPEPVFVPRGAQYASALVSSLLTGPGTAERGAVRSYLPPKASEVLSVPVRNGMAEIDLRNVGEQSTQAIHLMTAQLA
ncbi:MAG: GerMN domain-containing protein, partial [Nocardioides sp.]|nr:GerMN domain-containing protein [Nocardioides sp.]